ncbi:3-epi-6-deoxocathasterone 23-monooxygenase [Forsythia ovata]|uniref:3-epi-6-deoxocathasterone 23-monooxygenase n=1 Tax=Forsythia ovata TaxID=205694 RepID=A0ABD1TUD8_9LAMI
MDIMWSLLMTTTLLSAIILYRKIKSAILSSYYSSPLPLGTLGWPFIGETIEFISSALSHSPESFMDKRRRMYGKVFKSHIFGSATIISTDAESSNLKAQITSDMHKYLLESTAKWTEDCPVYIQDETKNIAFQVLVKALIGLDPGHQMDLLKKQFQEFIGGLMSLPINLPGSQLYRSLQAKKKMVKMIHRIIQEKRSRNNIPVVPKDVADVLVSDTSEQLTDDLIAENMIDLMIPGEDSVPVLMTLAIRYLSDCPAALQQLSDENLKLKSLKEKLGHTLSWNDYLSLPFTQTVITETLRMGNVIIGVMRKAKKDVEIKGYCIPKGWCVLAYFRSVHLDEDLYDFPYQFNPWRWQDKEMNICNFTPFGGGQRLCPGLDLARLETSIFLHQFVSQFRWVAEDDSIINFPTVRMKRRMPIWVKRRRDP